MVTYFFKTKIDICQSFQSHFYFFLKKYAYTVVYVLEILAFCIVDHTLPFLKSRSSKKIKERKSRELSNAIHIKMCEIVLLLIGNTQDI